MATFEVGQKVRLKSGGAPMTVRQHVESTIQTGMALGVHVDWMDVNGCAHRACFHPGQLESLERSPAVPYQGGPVGRPPGTPKFEQS